MSVKHDLKSVFGKEDITIKKVNDILNENLNRDSSYSSFLQRLNADRLRYTEIEIILNHLGYDIVWKKRDENK